MIICGKYFPWKIIPSGDYVGTRLEDTSKGIFAKGERAVRFLNLFPRNECLVGGNSVLRLKIDYIRRIFDGKLFLTKIT